MIKKIEKNGLNEKNKDKKNSGLAAILIVRFSMNKPPAMLVVEK